MEIALNSEIKKLVWKQICYLWAGWYSDLSLSVLAFDKGKL